MLGHVFVVHGDARLIACDELLVPTDVNGHVSAAWRGFGSPVLPEGWRSETTRVTEPKGEPGARVRWVNTGSLPDEAADKLGWLRAGIEQAFTAAARGLLLRKRLHRRSRHLVAAPVFGTGAGGFEGIRGAVIRDLLEAAQAAVAEREVDIVLVAHSRSDYVALQHQRKVSGRFALSTELTEHADRLGREMAAGRVAFFLGAGLSIPAGLPTWPDLISTLGAQSPRYASRVEDLKTIPAPDAAQLLSLEEGFRDRLKAALGSGAHALGHSLIASMRPAEVITTNFDALYEQAAQATYAEHLTVIPTERGAARSPWLLKLHGDIDGERIVLNRDEFLGYDTVWRPLAGMLQATMLTRHLVFVGYSLDDDNFIRLGRSVSALLRQMKYDKPIGTLLSPMAKPLRAELWGQDLTELATDEGDNPFRTHDIVLDRMALTATADERSWVLDEAYADLLSEGERTQANALRAAADGLGENDNWTALRTAFTSLGWTPSQQGGRSAT